MAFSHANRVAVIASHTKSARFLYPTTTTATTTSGGGGGRGGGGGGGSEDPFRDANKYRQFRLVEDQVQASFAELMRQTTVDDLVDAKETMMAGALGLALGYINRLVRVDDDGGVVGGKGGGGGGGGGKVGTTTTGAAAGTAGEVISMNARILVVSVSGDLAEQYVPVMNSIFAAQRKVGLCLSPPSTPMGLIEWMDEWLTGVRKYQLISVKSLARPCFCNRRRILLEVYTCNWNIQKAFCST